jgi:hypothetical protein
MQLVPPPFLKLVAAFYRGSEVEHATVEQWIDSRLLTLSADERSEVSRFLKGALAGDRASLQAAWDEGNSCYLFHGDSLMALLTLIADRSRILQQP